MTAAAAAIAGPSVGLALLPGGPQIAVRGRGYTPPFIALSAFIDMQFELSWLAPFKPGFEEDPAEPSSSARC